MSGDKNRVQGHTSQHICEGWQVASAPAAAQDGLAGLEDLQWLAATVPGTAAGAMREAGLWRAGDPRDFDSCEWWFRTSFDAAPAGPGEEVVLRMDGIATIAEVYLNGELLLLSESMFAAHAIEVGRRLAGANELVIRCRALSELLAVRRRPRARWRTRLLRDGSLRFFRTMLLGRMPGSAPGPAAVGPWRPISLERRRSVSVEELTLRPRVTGAEGVLSIRARLRPLGEAAIDAVLARLDGPSGRHECALELTEHGGEMIVNGELRVPEVARWWPHTHGEPALHRVELIAAATDGPLRVDCGHVGFRELAFSAAGADAEPERDGLAVHVNGVPVFARGAIWTPIDLVGMAPTGAQLRERLQLVRDAGMNILRIPGTAAYETAAFHDLCDELGILVWQDFMFANLDYPVSEQDFRERVVQEASSLLDSLGGRPSLAVLCGNSEVEQQVAMLGLEPELGRGELFGSLLPELIGAAAIDAAYLPSAPCGGELPFRPDSGVANYFGVGAYRRGLEDARRAGVLFASECLAFSNVPDAEAIEDMLAPGESAVPVHGPAWKAGVPRDAGAGWDFEDVRDHYLSRLYGLDAAQLRSVDQARYLELSRALTGELMAEVFGEWRRSASPCGGGIVLSLGDLAPGAGWGLLDHRGEPKAAYHHLARALAPVAVWTIDEGLGGVIAHVANDRPEPLQAELRIALYSGGERVVGDAVVPVALAGHSQAEWNLESALGRFVDISWAYRFGPPAQDAIVVSLLGAGGPAAPLSQAVRFPDGCRPLEREPAERIGLRAHARPSADGDTELQLSSSRLAHGVRVHAPGYAPPEQCFTLEPGVPRVLRLAGEAAQDSLKDAHVTAVNMHGRVRITLEP